MNMRNLVLLAASLFFSGSVLAADGEALVKSNHCMNCHTIDKRAVGPSFKEIAAKYGNNKGAHATLENKVRNGGGGAWGSMPMPATAKSVSDIEIKSMVQWVLSLK